MKYVIAGLGFMLNLVISASIWYYAVVNPQRDVTFGGQVLATIWFAFNLLTAISVLFVKDDEQS